MRPVPIKASRERILPRFQRALFACVRSTLTEDGFLMWDDCIFQEEERRQRERLLIDRHRACGGARQTTSSTSPNHSPAPANSGLNAHIEIPRTGLSPIVEDKIVTTALPRGFDQFAGTTPPARPRTANIAACSPAFFRPRRNIRQNDIALLATLPGTFRRRVAPTSVEDPRDVAVPGSGRIETLTLGTCYPYLIRWFYYLVGSAPGRFVVRAERVGKAS